MTEHATDPLLDPPAPGAEPGALAERRYREDVWQRLISHGVLLAPLAVALGVSFLVTPEAIESGSVLLSPPCTFKTLFGIPCLSCGMTRAFAALSHGQLVQAFHYNHLAPLVYPVVWGLALYAGRGLAYAVRDLRQLARRS